MPPEQAITLADSATQITAKIDLTNNDSLALELRAIQEKVSNRKKELQSRLMGRKSQKPDIDPAGLI